MRYLSLQKYNRILKDGALHLARLDQFEDKFEGSLPRRTIAAIKSGKAFQNSFLKEESDRRYWAKQYYVSCWHMADEESDAMWRLYCGKEGGVCLVSTYNRLSRLNSGGKVLLGIVRYVDYEVAEFDWDDDAPVVHKRKAFAHEKEVRIVSPHVCNLLLISRDQARAYVDRQPNGYRLGWHFSDIVTRVLVSPYSTEDAFDWVQQMTEHWEQSKRTPVTWSKLRDTPSF